MTKKKVIGRDISFNEEKKLRFVFQSSKRDYSNSIKESYEDEYNNVNLKLAQS